MQTSPNFAFWIKGSISLPLHVLRQDQSHIPAWHLALLVINLASALWWVARWEHSLLGEGKKGWEQNNKRGGLRSLLYAMCCRKLYLVVHCQKIIFCYECYWSIMEGIYNFALFFFENVLFLRCEFGASVVYCCFPLPFFSIKSQWAKSCLLVGSRDVLSTCVPLLKRICQVSFNWKRPASDYSWNLKMLEGCWIFLFYCGHLLLDLMKVCVCGRSDYKEVKSPRAHQRWLRPELLRAFKQLSAPCLSWIILCYYLKNQTRCRQTLL